MHSFFFVFKKIEYNPSFSVGYRKITQVLFAFVKKLLNIEKILKI
jgi:hypothetical protein